LSAVVVTVFTTTYATVTDNFPACLADPNQLLTIDISAATGFDTVVPVFIRD
jgi:hypothetical protein